MDVLERWIVGLFALGALVVIFKDRGAAAGNIITSIGNAGTNQSEGGRTPSSAYGEAFKRAANRGRTMLRMAPQMQPPLPAEAQGVGGTNLTPGGASGSGAVREARATVYHAFDPQLSG